MPLIPQPRQSRRCGGSCAAISSYSSCQCVGPFERATCTAVTLYSGQFVAQSEYSVVIDVGLRVRMMERRVDDARRHTLGYECAQRRFRRHGLRASPNRRRECRAVRRRADAFPTGLPRATATLSVRLRLGADIVLRQDAAGGEQEWEARTGTFRRSATYSVMTNLPLPRTKPLMCMTGVPSGAFSLHGHCIEPSSSSRLNETPAKVGVRWAISSMICEGWL